MEEKRFNEWIEKKKSLHFTGRCPVIKDGEVWWCAIGENVGVEVNGKNTPFSRPVVILKKLSRHSFMGVPLTSKFHEGSWYVHFVFKDADEYANLSQARTFSTSRLYDKIGQLPNFDLELIKDGFFKLYK